MERAYSLADSDERWFANLAGALDFWGDSLDSRWAGGFFEVDTRGRVSITSEWNDGVQLPVSLVETAERMHPADRSATFLGPLGLSSFDEVESRMPVLGRAFREGFALANFPDGAFMCTRDASGKGALFARFCPRLATARGHAQRKRLRQLALHIASAMRLRRAMRHESSDRGRLEAVLDGSGKLRHAEPAASSTEAREKLRHAVLELDRARSQKGRDDQQAALDAWTALVAGRWTLLERFERDGQRFFVAYENRAFASDPRGLTANERAVAARIAEGHSSKEIAYELGLSEPTVSMRLKTALRKLGFNAASELAYHTTRLRCATSGSYGDRLVLEGEPVEVLCVPAQPGAPGELSSAEFDVASLAVVGHSNAAIAAARGVSIRTVANQLASACRKLRVCSRAELAIYLAAPR
jgi:DNA-binding CsgD family transcriptional regulator